ncbi:helix-turn-helix domain-containing protein [Streptomyces sp. NPDC058157]|uniref:helix-turn-helix domain-containing protein n=1 Tax=Streptomyces sp. NPDC058157 TaxID=3346360 RepID=UPI0036ECBA8E
MAGVARLPVRQFEHLFADLTGLPSGRWIAPQRIRDGASLLESSTHPVDTVAGRVGLTVAGFRHHFRQAMGVIPSTYRRQFRPSSAPATAAAPQVQMRPLSLA